jgi:hypothetical protein
MRLGLLKRDKPFMPQRGPPLVTGRPMQWHQGLHSQSDIHRAKIHESQLSPTSRRSLYRGNDMGTARQTELYCAASGNGTSIMRGFGPKPFRMNGLVSGSNSAIHKAVGRGQPVTQDISLSVRGDKVVCPSTARTSQATTKLPLSAPEN